MAKLEYNIPELLAIVSHIRYSPQLGQAVNELLNADSQLDYEIAMEEATTLLVAHEEFSSGVVGQFGLPAFMPLIIDNYAPDIPELILDSSIVSVQQSKDIVTTKVNKRKSTVKEFITDGDYVITVKGLLCSRRIGYPIDLAEEFKNYMQQNQNLSVVHELLNMLGIDEIVVTSWGLPESPFINCQPYEFSALSDVPLQLRIDE